MKNNCRLDLCNSFADFIVAILGKLKNFDLIMKPINV